MRMPFSCRTWLSPRFSLQSLRRANRAGQLSSLFHGHACLQSVELKMPSLSPTMTEGNIIRWCLSEGDSFITGDVLCEIQTDKAVLSLEAEDDGCLAKIVRDAEDGPIKINTLIAILADEDEDWQTVASQSSPHARPGEAEGAVEEDGAKAEPPSDGVEGTAFKMPSLSPTMTEGTIVKWHKGEGDVLRSGDLLCDIQTDKAVVSMDIDEDDVVLAKILANQESGPIEIGQAIALTVEEGEDWTKAVMPKPSSEDATARKDEDANQVEAGSASSQEPKTEGSHKIEHLDNVGPAATLLMAAYGIQAADLGSGSGPKGLTKQDVLHHIASRQLQPLTLSVGDASKVSDTVEKEKSPSSTRERPRYTDIPLTSLRTIIAKRLTESKQRSPHGHSTIAIDMARVLRLRSDLRSMRGTLFSVNDFIVKAVGEVLRPGGGGLPELNLNLVPGPDGHDTAQLQSRVDISVAVATETGLITPILCDVGAKSVRQISSETRALVARAREGKLQPHEFQGGTFTVSNLGMFGVSAFTAIINPPQAAILAVGSALSEVIAAKDDMAFKASPIARMTLSFDRRFIDEALAAQFMSTLRAVLERPEQMDLGLSDGVDSSASVPALPLKLALNEQRRGLGNVSWKAHT